MVETWRLLPSDQQYEISDEGRVRTIERVNERGWHLHPRVKHLTPHSDGYLTAWISDRMRKVHQLVLEAFEGPCPDGFEVLHLDSNRTNNRLDNLRYGSRSENQLQRVADGNHYLAVKTRCIRGHLLVEPNLKPAMLRRGQRSCKACGLGRQYVKRHPGFDLQIAADSYYRLAT